MGTPRLPASAAPKRHRFPLLINPKLWARFRAAMRAECKCATRVLVRYIEQYVEDAERRG